MSKTVTADMLRDADACAHQVERFQRVFPGGVDPTRELCLRHAGDFNFFWAARQLLTPSAWHTFRKSVPSAWHVLDDGDEPSAVRAFKEAVAAAWFDAWSTDTSKK